MNILAIDQGTSATKALLVGPGQQVLGAGEVPVSVHPAGAGGVEADPEELYRSVIGAGSGRFRDRGLGRVQGLGLHLYCRKVHDGLAGRALGLLAGRRVGGLKAFAA